MENKIEEKKKDGRNILVAFYFLFQISLIQLLTRDIPGIK